MITSTIQMIRLDWESVLLLQPFLTPWKQRLQTLTWLVLQYCLSIRLCSVWLSFPSQLRFLFSLCWRNSTGIPKDSDGPPTKLQNLKFVELLTKSYEVKFRTYKECVPLGTTWVFLTFDNHLAPAFVLALIWFRCKPIKCTKLGRFRFAILACNFLWCIVCCVFWWFYCENLHTLHIAINHISHVVTKFKGDGAVVVRCMFLISLERPYFHSMSDWAWWYSNLIN